MWCARASLGVGRGVGARHLASRRPSLDQARGVCPRARVGVPSRSRRAERGINTTPRGAQVHSALHGFVCQHLFLLPPGRCFVLFAHPLVKRGGPSARREKQTAQNPTKRRRSGLSWNFRRAFLVLFACSSWPGRLGNKMAFAPLAQMEHKALRSRSIKQGGLRLRRLFRQAQVCRQIRVQA